MARQRVQPEQDGGQGGPLAVRGSSGREQRDEGLQLQSRQVPGPSLFVPGACEGTYEALPLTWDNKLVVHHRLATVKLSKDYSQ